MKRTLAILSSLILFLFCVALSSASAQGNGRIKGTVTDPTGAVIASATVTATNEDTLVKFNVVSSGNGDYFFASLPIGTYDITVSANGFKGFSAKGIVLNIDQEYVEPIKLTVGSGTEQVQVEADAVQVNTTDMQLSNVVNSAQMEELPLIGRNFTGLELTLPGVQASSDRFGTYSVSGAQTQQSEFLINGADSNDIALNTLAIAPNLDAIDQFNLIDGPLNAEYDRNSGGIVAATIKQGTNHFHGDAFEFYRDTFLNTLSFFQKACNYTTGVCSGTVSPYHQNIFGGTVGGPIFKDKLFFFGAYQGIHQRVPDNAGNNVYSTGPNGNLGGNFTADNPTSLGTRPVVVANQCGTGVSGTANWGNYSGCDTIPSTINITGCTAGEFWSQCAYDRGGSFLPSNFNSIATKLVSTYVPAPNNGTYGYIFNGATKTTSNQEIGRIDYALSPKNQFTVLGIYFKSNVTDALPFTGASLPGFGDLDLETIQQYTFDYVRQVSSTAVNDFAIHWTRFNYQAVEPQTVVTPSSLGFSITPQLASAASVPTIAVGGNFVNFTLGFSTNGPQPRIDQVYQLDDNFSKTFGHHQLKFGYDGRRFNVSNPFSAVNSGDFNFGSTGASTNSPYSTGDGALDFLLGIPGGYSQGTGAVIQADAFLNYIYAQDSWKLANTFTLDYGLGYSIDTPLENHQYGGEGIACLATTPTTESGIFPTAPVGVAYPGDPGCYNTGQARTKYTELGPRIGFAWAPDLGRISGSPGKFSIVGGFGIYFDRSEEETALQTLETPPFGLSSGGAGDFGGVPTFANPFVDINGGLATGGTAMEANKFPYVPPVKGAKIPYSTWATLEPLDISTFAPSFRAPYAENFQLTVSREFASRTVVKLSYVGSLARHNTITYEGNYETAAGHAACLAGNETSPVIGATISCTSNRNLQSYYFPNNTAYGQVDANTGNPTLVSAGEVGSESSSSYNSLQASVLKGLTHGLTFQLSYTYAHALDNGSNFENSGFGESGTRGYNQFQQSLNYGDSAYDARQRLVFSPIYITPILAGKSQFSPLNLALSGWEISGITTVATGFPYDISYAGGTSLSLYCTDDFNFYACPDVPNQNGPISRGNPRARLSTNGDGTWFNKVTPGGVTTFTAETLGSFGNTHRNPYHGPGVNNTNAILAKNFNLSADGVMKLQLRMESDNVFNHTQFSNPTGTFTSSTLGLVTSSAAARQTQLAAKFYF